jgi:hypothetical protein
MFPLATMPPSMFLGARQAASNNWTGEGDEAPFLSGQGVCGYAEE